MQELGSIEKDVCSLSYSIQYTEGCVQFIIECTVYRRMCAVYHTVYNIQKDVCSLSYSVQYTGGCVQFIIQCTVFRRMCAVYHKVCSIQKDVCSLSYSKSVESNHLSHLNKLMCFMQQSVIRVTKNPL